MGKLVSSPSLLVGTFALSINAGSAKAVIFNFNGTDDDATTFSHSYAANPSECNTPTLGGDMPRRGSRPLADQFASALGNNLGDPFLAFELFPAIPNGVNPQGHDTGFQQTSGFLGLPGTQTFLSAEASLVPAAVPGPMPIFGAAAAFGVSRRLRRRIKATPTRF